MKKFPIKSVAVAASFACAGAVLAGTFLPADSGALKFAAESLSATTKATMASSTYTLGIDRASASEFTVIMTPSVSGTLFHAEACTNKPVVASGTATVSPKRSSTTECAWSIIPTSNLQNASSNFTVRPVFATHTLNTSGSSVGVVLDIRDAGELSRLDNAASITRTVGTAVNALGLVAPTEATGTIVDVNFVAASVSKPLMGFVGGLGNPVGTTTVARAPFYILNNATASTAIPPVAAAVNAKAPDGSTDFDWGNTGTAPIAVTVTGNFQGLSAVGVTTNANPGVAVGSAPVVTVNAASTSATFTLARTDLYGGGAGTLSGFTLNLTAAGTASLGTSRTFAISAVATPVSGTGAAVSLAGSASWWTWTANAIQLSTPFFNTDSGSGVNTRFFFSNSGTTAANYSTVCSVETGTTVVQKATALTGTTHTGSLAVGTTMIDAKDLCTISGGTAVGRGSVVFTVNAPASQIKGVYNLGAVGGGNAYIPLNRPYAGNTD
jgi:hypothetical protein